MIDKQQFGWKHKAWKCKNSKRKNMVVPNSLELQIQVCFRLLNDAL